MFRQNIYIRERWQRIHWLKTPFQCVMSSTYWETFTYINETYFV